MQSIVNFSLRPLCVLGVSAVRSKSVNTNLNNSGRRYLSTQINFKCPLSLFLQGTSVDKTSYRGDAENAE